MFVLLASVEAVRPAEGHRCEQRSGWACSVPVSRTHVHETFRVVVKMGVHRGEKVGCDHAIDLDDEKSCDGNVVAEGESVHDMDGAQVLKVVDLEAALAAVYHK